MSLIEFTFRTFSGATERKKWEDLLPSYSQMVGKIIIPPFKPIESYIFGKYREDFLLWNKFFRLNFKKKYLKKPTTLEINIENILELLEWLKSNAKKSVYLYSYPEPPPYYNDTDKKWFLVFKDPRDATLFKLRCL